MSEWTVERVEELLAELGQLNAWQRGGKYWDNQTVTAKGETFIADCGNNIMTERVAEFIAAAPEIIRFLLDSLTRARQEADKKLSNLVVLVSQAVYDAAPCPVCSGELNAHRQPDCPVDLLIRRGPIRVT